MRVLPACVNDEQHGSDPLARHEPRQLHAGVVSLVSLSMRSGPIRQRSSSKTRAASSNEMPPCFCRFQRFLALYHFVQQVVYTYCINNGGAAAGLDEFPTYGYRLGILLVPWRYQDNEPAGYRELVSPIPQRYLNDIVVISWRYCLPGYRTYQTFREAFRGAALPLK